MTRITTTVETVSIANVEAGDTILGSDGERIVIETVTSCVPHRLYYRDSKGQHRSFPTDCVLRVVPEEAAEEPVWPDADLIRIIRGTENGNRIDGSLAYRIDGGHGFRLLDGPRVEYALVHGFPGDAIFEWEEVVPVAKSAILAGLGTEDDEPEDDNTDDDAESEKESEDEEECDGSCLACILMRVLTMAAGKEDAA